eukprot:c19561_g1_i1.p1 GENE.c19561_g1_i1~~c19561_g1_i1.p1  ORF type:complete len:168 (+),score=26.80 c19561_g1_i1:37-540(+)
MLYHRSTIGWDSLLITPQYCGAMALAWTELLIEGFLFPEMKIIPEIFYTGLALVLFGEFWRKGAMIQAGMAFTYDIKTSRRDGHNLVKTGFYKYVRHPGYFGWFIWSISTQIMLANPISVVVFSIASWYFFYMRIPYEELQLIRFFGDEYIDYRKRTFTGVPFVYDS